MRISNREVQVTYQFFVDDLQNDMYIDAMQSLVELYEYAKQGATIPNELWIIENLPTHKTGIMKRILRYIKTFNQDEVNRFVPMMIAALRHFGIDWPELNVISKSLRSELKENNQLTNEFINYLLDGIKDSLKHGTVKGVIQDVSTLYSDRQWDTVKPKVLDLLAQHKTKLLDYLNKPVSSVLLTHICLLLDMGVNWPEFEQYLRNKKPEIIKWLLTAFKGENAVYINNTVPKLIQSGLDWPELKTILKSSSIEANRYKALDESYMSSNELNEFFDIERNFNANQIYYALLLIDKNDFTATRHPDIAEILDDQQDNIQEFMLHRLERKDVFEVIRIFDIVQSTKIGWTWPKQFLEQHKHNVIKLLLITVVNPYGDPELALDLAWMLKKNGITWPELSIIEKSVKADTNHHAA